MNLINFIIGMFLLVVSALMCFFTEFDLFFNAMVMVGGIFFVYYSFEKQKPDGGLRDE